MSHPLAARFARLCAEGHLLDTDAPVVVALSGGLDSQVLLHLLRFATHRARGALFAAHFDHRMRTGSGADVDWCAGLSRAWEVPLIAAVSCRPLASETAARAARYDFFHAVARALPGATIATAHHADDQAETVLFRLLRGTDVYGLRGIPARRPPFVRPLLDVPRRELASYAGHVCLRAREDTTNADISRPRAFIRHVLLPHLEATRPGARDALLRLASAAAGFEARLQPVLEQLENTAVVERREGEIRLASSVLRPYHHRIQAAFLHRLLRVLGRAPGRAGTRAALQFISTGRSGSRIELPGGLVIERSFDVLTLRRPAAHTRERALAIDAPGSGAGLAIVGGRRLRVDWALVPRGEGATDGPRARADGGGWSTELDPGTVAFPLRLRGWRAGDRIRMSYGSKKLKKLFGERRYDTQARSRTPVLAEGRDRVLWVVGVARAVDAPPPADGVALRITVTDD